MNFLRRSGASIRGRCIPRDSRAQEVGFKNINVDIIYALPGQTIEDVKETLDIAFTLGVQHFSAYSLIVEPKQCFIT